MTVKYIDVYTGALRILRKETAGRALKPTDFDGLKEFISDRRMSDIYQAYSKDTNNTDNINRFFDTATIYKSITKEATLPSDYLHHRGVVSSYTDRNTSVTSTGLDILTDTEYMESLKSYIYRPQIGKEKAVIENNKLVILTGSDSSSSFSAAPYWYAYLPYIRKPDVPDFNYEVNSDGVLVSSDDNGFDFEDDNLADLIQITLEIMGIQLKRQDIYQYSTVQQIQGKL